MTMYLPNPELHPTGSEMTEFIDVPPTTQTPSTANGAVRRPEGTPVRLDLQTRLNIARWAEEYIAGLVKNHNGDPEDVRSIIHDLQQQYADTDHDGGL